ncbi:TPA: 50S ribosomal protein L6 [Enterococcus faecium]|nr:50S ribosomal protein L6 [Enterococcus faecium]
MSRIGNKVVVIPEGVTVTQDGNNVTVKGPKGELTRTFSADIKMNIEGNEVTFTRPNDSKEMKTIHGTTRANFNNMVVGVSEGFQKALELIGVGYRAQLQGSKLVLNVGYSHPVEITPPAGVTVEVPANTQVIVKGANKEEVGEYVRRKEGKTGK